MSHRPGMRRTIRGEEHVLTVLLVTGRDHDGRPRECRFVREDERVQLKGGEEFITAFVLARVMEAKVN